MVLITELKGTTLKRDLRAFRVVKLYHNHNHTGGNFGFYVIIWDPFKQEAGLTLELRGVHDLAGHIKSLDFGEAYQVPANLWDASDSKELNYQQFIDFLNRWIPERIKFLQAQKGKVKHGT